MYNQCISHVLYLCTIWNFDLNYSLPNVTLVSLPIKFQIIAVASIQHWRVFIFYVTSEWLLFGWGFLFNDSIAALVWVLKMSMVCTKPMLTIQQQRIAQRFEPVNKICWTSGGDLSVNCAVGGAPNSPRSSTGNCNLTPPPSVTVQHHRSQPGVATN